MSAGRPRPPNPVQRLLDERHVPWRESQSALIARYGVVPDPWWGGPDIVTVAIDPPPLPGLLRPLQFEPSPRGDPAQPPIRFSGWAWASRGRWLRDRATVSLEMVAESLAPALGAGAPYDTSNTKGLRWDFGPAWVEAICFPRRLNRGPQPAAAVDARFPDSCWIDLHSGYRPPLSDAERAWLGDFNPDFTLCADLGDAEAIVRRSPRQELLDYVRTPAEGIEKADGMMQLRGDALMFASDQLYVVPLAHVVHVEVERVHPARGLGYSALSLACRGDYGDRPLRLVPLTKRSGSEDLDQSGRNLAEWLERPCRFEDRLDD